MCRWTSSDHEAPLLLTSGAKLKGWRERNEITRRVAAERMAIPYSTYCRYEAGQQPPLDKANQIVATTRGAVRYRDLWVGFNPGYA